MNPETVPSKFAATLLNLVSERGKNYDVMLERAGIEFDPQKPELAGWQERITARQYSRLYQEVLKLIQDEMFGAKVIGNVTPGSFRMMCYAILGCENLGKAIHRACEFYRIFFDKNAHIYLLEDDEVSRVGYAGINSREPDDPVQTGDVYGMSAWHRFYCWLIDLPIDLKFVNFSGAAPDAERIAKFESLFNCPVQFSQPNDQFAFDTKVLSNPIVRNEQALREFLRTAPYPLMVIPGSTSDTSLSARVRSLIGHDFSQGVPDFDRVTDALNMSAPTLRRKLRKEGTSFQQIKDESRRDAAQAFLENSDLSINAIAVLMGFTDPSAFHRCFKKWTNMTPGEYRQQASEKSEQALLAD